MFLTTCNDCTVKDRALVAAPVAGVGHRAVGYEIGEDCDLRFPLSSWWRKDKDLSAQAPHQKPIECVFKCDIHGTAWSPLKSDGFLSSKTLIYIKQERVMSCSLSGCSYKEPNVYT
jgi:hypothetical protein